MNRRSRNAAPGKPAGPGLIGLGLIGLGLLMPAGCRPPENATSSDGWPVFTAQHGTNAFDRVARLVEISPRDSGTANAAYAAQWIAQELREIGLRPVADTWRERTATGPMIFSNVYAELPGETEHLIVIGSHFDTKSGIAPDFQGANDGGSSTGLALELARVLHQQAPRLRHTIRFAFFDGQECVVSYRPDDGLHGSKRMARQLARKLPDRPVVAVLVIDMVGDRNLTLQVPRNVTPWLARIALDSATVAEYPLLTIGRGAILDDHWPFIELGMPAVVLIDFEYGSAPGRNDYWHTPEDTLDKLSPDSLWTTGRIVLEMLRRIEQGDGVPDAKRIDGVPDAGRETPDFRP